MQIDEIIECLSSADESLGLPDDALLAAKSHWAELFPLVDHLMDKFIDKPDSLSERDNSLLFYGVLLMAEIRYHDGLEKLLQMCSREDCWESDLENVFGDVITELMPTVFYYLANGTPRALNHFILDAHESEYCRSAAIEAIFQQFFDGSIEHSVFESMLEQWITHFLEIDDPDLAGLILGSICSLCIVGRLDAYKTRFIQLSKDNKLDDDYLSLEDIEEWDDDLSQQMEPQFHIVKDFNVINELTPWHGFSNEDAATLFDEFDDEDAIDMESLEIEKIARAIVAKNQHPFDISEPHTSAPKIGRNEPCPCGSGKKYKKCCLH